MEKHFKLDESLSVIIPAYNEEGNLINLINDTVKDAKKVSKNFEVIIINDGSSDNTGAIADTLAKTYKEVRAVHHKKNKGLASAWKTGIQTSQKKIILYIEGDGQQPFSDQQDLLAKIKNADLVLGTRSHRFDYTPFRKALSYGYLFLIRLFFNLKYKDVGWSQAYRRKIFNKIKVNSVTPFFDTEVVIKAKKSGFKIVEAISYYRPRKTGSTSLGNIKTAYRMLREMIMMKFGFLD
ncbi:MAG: glycosyltransferase family 2 protein [Patescibacteria group bacterium]